MLQIQPHGLEVELNESWVSVRLKLLPSLWRERPKASLHVFLRPLLAATRSTKCCMKIELRNAIITLQSELTKASYATWTTFFFQPRLSKHISIKETNWWCQPHCNQKQPPQFICTGRLAINQVNNLKKFITRMDFGLNPQKEPSQSLLHTPFLVFLLSSTSFFQKTLKKSIKLN